MTDIRLNGPPELVAAAFEAIKTVIPGIYDERHYEARDGSGDDFLYAKIPEPNQTIIINLQEQQVIEYCRTWRSKSEVARYFTISFEAASEILDRMFEAGTLVRDLDESGARRHHHYIYLDATKKDGNEFGW